jgi:hypothetical protein
MNTIIYCAKTPGVKPVSSKRPVEYFDMGPTLGGTKGCIATALKMNSTLVLILYTKLHFAVGPETVSRNARFVGGMP